MRAVDTLRENVSPAFATILPAVLKSHFATMLMESVEGAGPIMPSGTEAWPTSFSPDHSNAPWASVSTVDAVELHGRDCGHARARGGRQRYRRRRRRNWSTGRVPGAGDDVVLDGNDDVLIDPTERGGSRTVAVRALEVRGAARLEAVRGVTVSSLREVVADHGQIIFRASADVGESLDVANGADGLIVANPRPIVKRDVILKTSITMEVGIGGLAPASSTVEDPKCDSNTERNRRPGWL